MSDHPAPVDLPRPLLALSVLANPTDLARFDESRVWREIEEALRPLAMCGSVVLERLAHPTENALRRCLSQREWHVVHFVVHAQERLAAHYGAIALQSSEGLARNVTGPYLAGLLTATRSPSLVILQACDEASYRFATVAHALSIQGVAAVLAAPPLRGRQAQIFVSKVYAGLLAGQSAGGLSTEVSAALAAHGGAPDVLAVSQYPQAPIFRAHPPVSPPVDPSVPPASLNRSNWQEQLERKRTAGKFDVFLCHNSADKPAVKRIGQQLKEAGILPWLDVWELPPGQPWQPLLERQIESVGAAAVFIGAAGIAPWQEREMYVLLLQLGAGHVPVIPVLLPDAPSQPELPAFLHVMTWVDFRSDDPDPLNLLIWGITGNRPSD